MRRSEFERLIEDAWLALPEKVRAKLVNLAVVIEDRPTKRHYEEADAANHEEGELLGLYVGLPATERSLEDSGLLPDKIILFKDIIEAEAEENEGGDVGLVVRETLWHEIAHYFGFDEDGARRLEEKWRAEGEAG